MRDETDSFIQNVETWLTLSKTDAKKKKNFMGIFLTIFDIGLDVLGKAAAATGPEGAALAGLLKSYRFATNRMNKKPQDNEPTATEINNVSLAVNDMRDAVSSWALNLNAQMSKAREEIYGDGKKLDACHDLVFPPNDSPNRRATEYAWRNQILLTLLPIATVLKGDKDIILDSKKLKQEIPEGSDEETKCRKYCRKRFNNKNGTDGEPTDPNYISESFCILERVQSRTKRKVKSYVFYKWSLKAGGKGDRKVPRGALTSARSLPNSGIGKRELVGCVPSLYIRHYALSNTLKGVNSNDKPHYYVENIWTDKIEVRTQQHPPKTSKFTRYHGMWGVNAILS